MSHLRYAKYLLRHKWFVFLAGLQTKAPLWRLLIHDWSKFLPCEWIPYAAYFYGKLAWLKDNEPDDYRYWTLAQPYIAAFDRAWLHHQHRNPHHWQHWVLREDSGATKLLPMPEYFVREMVADWAGAGRAITGKWDVAKWYAANSAKIQLNEQSRRTAETLLQIWASPEVAESAEMLGKPPSD